MPLSNAFKALPSALVLLTAVYGSTRLVSAGTNPIRQPKARRKHARTMTAACSYPPDFAPRSSPTASATPATW